MEVLLFEPEIPQNTGNIGRLCVNAGVSLGIIGNPSFSLEEKAVRRAGLDYWKELEFRKYADWEDFLATQTTLNPQRIFLVSKFGRVDYAKLRYLPSDRLVFGRETKGLPKEILEDPRCFETIHIPMAENSRSINLSNAVAIVLFEALRQMRIEQK